MTDNTNQEAFTVEEIEAVYREGVAPLYNKAALLHFLRANRKPKARPAFVGDMVHWDGTPYIIIGTDCQHDDIAILEGRHRVRYSDLTHPDGAPVSKGYPPIPDTVHRSQLVPFDELGDERWYSRLAEDGLFQIPVLGRRIKPHQPWATQRFYPLPTVEGDDDA